MAYFDNAATTYPKPDCVYSFMDEFYRNSGGSAGRGNYSLASSAKGLIDETRKLLQDLLHCPAKQVLFTPTATIALNIIIQGIIATGIKNVYISPFEHNAVTRTLHHFEELEQIKVIQLSVSPSLKYDLERIKYQFDAVKPDFLIISHASNVIGLIAPVEEICTLAKDAGAITLVDMAQTAGLVDLNVGLEAIDFAVFAGHKTLLGPTGISGFIMNPAVNLPPVLFGGTGYDSANQNMPGSLPEKYEMGTLNEKLLAILTEYDFLSVVGYNPDCKYVGIVSCLMDGISSDSAGKIFSDRGISVRTGLQCAPKAHQFIGTYPAGTIRLSVNLMTADTDFEALRYALDDIEANM